ncbi:hypothetical protein BH09CHL1_BH09CHL1_13240 [soil metagenome]
MSNSNRTVWTEVPERIRSAIEGYFGSPVVSAESKSGGFSPGLASVLTTADGRAFFVKAADPEQNADSAAFHRREAVISAALPDDAPVPRLLWTFDEGEAGWIVLVFEAIAGRNPQTPWVAGELDQVVESLISLSDALTPSPLPESIAPRTSRTSIFARPWWALLQIRMPVDLDPWAMRNLDRLVELNERTPRAVDGETLLQHDMRADNMLITDHGVVIVDWPHARIGAPWIDILAMAPSVQMQGGPKPDEFVLRHPAARAANQADIDAAVAGLAGYFNFQSMEPPPPGIPTVRKFQRDQGVVALAWLAERTGWE